ncbi:chorismate mutase [Buchnera aphidicola]|uniref:Bifunctional chorismate mutase/prephenate dehydratase n=1 Tax=Buchnera aphidicola subsp. Rhopalosiphum maidis TaxID=118109 RepID=A0A3G2I5J7_BUCRM|nr:chorismate mutase [Buchnera aphidicola]AYN24680.1 chorismate mutase [Buchnera aphidicola (Rhopalosiphum maidis)]
MPSKNDLLNFRNEINEIDKNIVQLLVKRKKLVLNIARSKIKNNQPIRDIEREKNLLEKLTNLAKKNNLDINYITRLFQLIIEESVLTQKKLLNKFCNDNNLNCSRFSFLGPKGSYSHIAASQYAERNFKMCIENACFNFKEVVQSVENNQTDYAVLPIENSCSGFINEIFDILKKTNLFIIGEINILINHCLLAIKKIELNKIKTIYSHPQPFQQCSYFINQFPNWKIQYTNSTADAMKKIANYNVITNAALGSELGSKIYGLKVLSKNLANKKKNITRFILLSRKPVTFSSKIPTKTTLIFNTGQESGALAEVLLILKKKKLIMKKLTSQNIYKNPWEEMFYIDIQANLSSSLMQETLDQIRKITKFIKVLGCYPSENTVPVIP